MLSNTRSTPLFSTNISTISTKQLPRKRIIKMELSISLSIILITKSHLVNFSEYKYRYNLSKDGLSHRLLTGYKQASWNNKISLGKNSHPTKKGQPIETLDKKRGELSFSSPGVTDGARTHDIWNHNPTLCQLSYSHHLRSSLYLVAKTCTGLLQTVNVNLQAAFEVGCFVLVNDVLLCEFVQHCSYFGKQSLSSSFVGGTTQCLHSVTSCSVVVLIRNPVSLGLANTFFR